MHKVTELRDSDRPVDVAWEHPEAGIDRSPAEIQTTATREAARAAALGGRRDDMCYLAFDASPNAAFGDELTDAAHDLFIQLIADALPISEVCSETSSRLRFVRFMAIARVTQDSIFAGFSDRKIAAELGVSQSTWREVVEGTARKLGRSLSRRLDFGTPKNKRVLPRPPGV